MDVPETHYVQAGDINLAYQVLGQGPLDLVYVGGWLGHVEARWELEPCARFLHRLASFCRLILFDKRGVGLSDPVPLTALPTLEEWMDDVRAVMDAVGSQRAALLATTDGGAMASLFAATFPERTSALVLINGVPNSIYVEGISAASMSDVLSSFKAMWGTGRLLQLMAPAYARDDDFVKAYGRYERQAASPGTAVSMLRMTLSTDVSQILPSIQAPTLLIQRRDSVTNLSALEDAVRVIPLAKYVETPGNEVVAWLGDQESVLVEVQEFVTGVRPVPLSDRVLATVLFTDIVDSTKLAAERGDRDWRDLLDRHRDIVRRQLGRHRGREVNTSGDGFLATFDGPARAIHCAQAIVQAVRALGIEVRAGLHTGECEISGGEIGGIAVHIGARVVGLAGPGEVLVSGSVPPLVAGAGIEFEDRGPQQLKGVPGEWRVFAVRD